jgi:ankyrin repeat protein
LCGYSFKLDWYKTGADVNAKVNDKGDTALHVAARVSRADLVRILVEFGVCGTLMH